ncbi:MAG: hypothetical protein ACRYFS_15305 [Janthinobacterium lividum]
MFIPVDTSDPVRTHAFFRARFTPGQWHYMRSAFRHAATQPPPWDDFLPLVERILDQRYINSRRPVIQAAHLALCLAIEEEPQAVANFSLVILSATQRKLQRRAVSGGGNPHD